jgi:hypothetical protein
LVRLVPVTSQTKDGLVTAARPTRTSPVSSFAHSPCQKLNSCIAFPLSPPSRPLPDCQLICDSGSPEVNVNNSYPQHRRLWYYPQWACGQEDPWPQTCNLCRSLRSASTSRCAPAGSRSANASIRVRFASARGAAGAGTQDTHVPLGYRSGSFIHIVFSNEVECLGGGVGRGWCSRSAEWACVAKAARAVAPAQHEARLATLVAVAGRPRRCPAASAPYSPTRPSPPSSCGKDMGRGRRDGLEPICLIKPGHAPCGLLLGHPPPACPGPPPESLAPGGLPSSGVRGGGHTLT